MSRHALAAVVSFALVTSLSAQKTARPTVAAPTTTTLAAEKAERALLVYYFQEETPGVWTAHCPEQELAFHVTASELTVANASSASAPFAVIARSMGFGRTSTVAPLATSAIRRTKNRLELDYGAGFSGWFVNDPCGLEQGWTIAAPPAGVTSEVVAVELELSGDLRFSPDPDACGGAFLDDLGRTCLRYCGLTVVDAAGTELSAHIQVQASGAVRIEFDDAGALYPVTIDPVFFGPVLTVSGTTGSEFGASVAGAGDVDGDGYDDLVVGAPGFTNPSTREGAAYLYRGSAQGLLTIPAWKPESNQAGADFGHVVAGVGDVNGDGFDDVVVGAPNYTDANAIAGRVYGYYGSASGLSTTPSWTIDGPAFCAMLGISVAGAGDVDADGYDDVVVGATGGPNGTGSAFVFRGSPSGLPTTPSWSFAGTTVAENLGAAVAGAGDIDGDGYDDIAVGAPHFNAVIMGGGVVGVFRGGPNGPSAMPDWVYAGTQENENLGATLAPAGDVNADGFDDLLVGSPLYDSVPFPGNDGRVLLFTGSAALLAPTPAWTVVGAGGGDRLGSALGSPGDANQNGYDDVLIGSVFGQTANVFSYEGSAQGLSTTPVWTAFLPGFSTGSVAHGPTMAFVGDTNHQGLLEIAFGTPPSVRVYTAQP